MNTTNLKQWLAVLTVLLISISQTVMARQAQKDDLYEAIQNLNKTKTRASGDVTVFDLSNYSATNRERSLPISEGRKVRFINGTLTRGSNYTGPIFEVSGGGYLEIGTKCVIDVSDTYGDAPVKMAGGEVAVVGGTVIGCRNAQPAAALYYRSIYMESDQDILTVKADDNKTPGTVSEPIECVAEGATINIVDGWFHRGTADFGEINTYSDVNVSVPQKGYHWLHVNLKTRTSVVNLTGGMSDNISLELTAPEKLEYDYLVKSPAAGLQDADKKQVTWSGDDKYFVYLDKKNNAMRLVYDDLWLAWWPNQNPYYPVPCGCSWDDPVPVTVPCDGKKVKEELEFPDDDLYWDLVGKPSPEEEATEDDCEGTIDEGENDIIVKPKAKVRIRRIHWRGCSCRKYIWVYGTVYIDYRVYFTYYWRFIHVMPGGHLVIKDLQGECEETVIHVEGGEVEYSGDNTKCTGGKYGWYCPSGVIYIRGGWLGGGTCGGWTGPKGKSYHYGGTVHGGIHNYGIHYWYGGYCTGGGTYTIYNYDGGQFYYYGGICGDSEKGKIWNEGDLYIDGGGSISCGDIYCIRGGCIYILKKLTFNICLIFTKENIVPGETVVVGADGYKLTQADVDKLQIVLPDGYKWNFDKSCGCISIIKTTGISGVDSDSPKVKESYSASGSKATDATKGMNIQRLDNGIVKKVIVK